MANAMAGADFYRQAHDIIKQAQTKLAETQQRLDTAYQRWEELDD